MMEGTAISIPGTSSTLYPKITGNTADLLYNLERLPPELRPTQLSLIGTVKLHGTHADIVIASNDSIRLQSRNRETLSIESDNHGFAACMAPLSSNILALKAQYYTRFSTLNPGVHINPDKPLIIAGEWIGQGIQKGVGIAQLTHRFVIVSASVNGAWLPDQDYADICDESVGIYNISRSGFAHATLELGEALQSSLAGLREVTNAVERECPFARTFGVVGGIGEGIVWKPVDAALSCNPDLWFKTKGPLHQHKVPVGPSDEKLVELRQKKDVVRMFVESVATEARLEQGWDYLREMGIRRDKKAVTMFLKWVQEDILVEEKREMEDTGLDEKMVKAAVARIASAWYLRRISADQT